MTTLSANIATIVKPLGRPLRRSKKGLTKISEIGTVFDAVSFRGIYEIGAVNDGVSLKKIATNRVSSLQEKPRKKGGNNG